MIPEQPNKNIVWRVSVELPGNKMTPYATKDTEQEADVAVQKAKDDGYEGVMKRPMTRSHAVRDVGRVGFKTKGIAKYNTRLFSNN